MWFTNIYKTNNRFGDFAINNGDTVLLFFIVNFFTKIFPENLFADSLIVIVSAVVEETPVTLFAGENEFTVGGVVSAGGPLGACVVADVVADVVE